MHEFGKLCSQFAFKLGGVLLLTFSTLEIEGKSQQGTQDTAASVCYQAPFAFPFNSNRERRWVEHTFTFHGSIPCILYTGQTHLLPKRLYFIEVLSLKSKKEMKSSVVILYVLDICY